MDHEPLEVLEVIRQWHQNPHEMVGRVQRGRAPQVRLPPQITWTFLGLIRYRQRKRWAWNILRKRLPEEVAAQRGGKPTVSFKDVMESGAERVIPGMTEWSFKLEGNLSFLTNRASGERIHIDVLNGPGATDSFDFREHLISRHRPTPSQQRMLRLFPNGRGMVPALNRLREAGLVHVNMDYDDDYGMYFALFHKVDAYDKCVREFLRAWADQSNRATLGAMIGDHLAVGEIAEANGDSPLARKAAARAAGSQRRWLSLLRYEAGDYVHEDVLWALAEAKPQELPQYLTAALNEPNSAAAALEIIQDDPAWRPQMELVWERACTDRWFSHIKGPAAFALARSGVAITPLVDKLMIKSGDHRDATLLALEFDPQHLLPLVRRGLRSEFRETRLTAAAILALVDTDQSRQELTAVLDESSDQDATIEARAALLESSDSRTEAAVREWEASYPDYDEDMGMTDRFLYRVEGGCDHALRREMSNWAKRVFQVRETIFHETP